MWTWSSSDAFREQEQLYPRHAGVVSGRQGQGSRVGLEAKVAAKLSLSTLCDTQGMSSLPLHLTPNIKHRGQGHSSEPVTSEPVWPADIILAYLHNFSNDFDLVLTVGIGKFHIKT